MALLALNACTQAEPFATPAAGYRNWWDQMRVALRVQGWLGYACTRTVREADGISAIESLPAEQCYRFNPAERIDGIWIDDFEGSMLLTQQEYRSGKMPDRSIWLDPGDKLPASVAKSHSGQAYHMVFVGRRARYPGGYGHLGMSQGLVLVDRIVSIERVPRN